jgi:putative hydrolase
MSTRAPALSGIKLPLTGVLMAYMTQEPFGDIPLFREIQRLLAAGGGPINYEIARQVAGAIAAQGGPDTTPSPETSRALAEAVYRSEAILTGFTRLALDEPLQGQVVGRRWWISSTLDAWKWLLERLAGRFLGAMGDLGPEDASGNPLQTAMQQIGPLLLGIQLGTLMGHLAREQLGRHDLPIPRDDDGKLFVVGVNVEELARGYKVPPDRLQQWIALNEVARGLMMRGVPWLNRFFKSRMTELVDSIEIDTGALERRLIDLQAGGMESIEDSLKVDDALPIVASDRHRRALENMQALVALFEGYARYASSKVAPEVVEDADVIDEIMIRRATTPTEGEKLLAGLLGLSFDRVLEQSGTTFCAAVVSLKGLPALNRVWDAPDNLPTFAEIKDPFLWIERVLSD